MKKKILMCEYCRHLIKETDVKCPNCGANCSKIIADYKAEKEAEEKARREEMEAVGKRNAKKVMLAGGAFLIVPIVMFVMITAGMVGAVMHFSKSEGPASSQKKESVTGTLDGEGKNEKFSVKIDGYEEYEYTSDSFKDMCNTRNGYQKIAFHIVVANETEETIDASLIRNIELKAGDEKAKSVSLEEDDAFCDLVQGEDKYTFFPYNGKILKGDKLSGYRGFEVSKKAEKIKFIINDDIVIEMDNPVYEKN